MSSTSAVAVLAQGLRDLKDFAEGPDGEDLQDRTGLSAEQIETALAGEHLPPREVTLALVEAWEGDVEAWEAYWAQIAELAKDADGGRRKTTPTPPEPSIITPIVAEAAPQPADEAVDASEDADQPAGAEAADEPSAEQTVADEAAGQDVAEDAPLSGGASGADETASTPAEPAAVVHQSSAEPPNKHLLTRIGIPALLFALGVGVGAFGDHALNSDSASKPQPASVPTASQGASSAPHTSQPSSSSAATSSSSHPTSASSSASESSESSSSSASSAGSSTSAGTALGAYSGIQLASGYSVDFLNDTYHPVTGTADGADTMGFFATSFVDGRFYADRVAILDPQETGSYTACLNDTRYQHDVLLSQVSAGSSFCVHTETGHLVLVTVRRMPSSTDANPYAVLDLTVWQGN